MSQELYINVMSAEVRAALVEDGILAELIIERLRRASLVGNVYLGRVERVMKGMDACFVNIGLDRAGFLGLDDGRRQGGDGPPVTEGEAVLVQVTKDAMSGKGVQLSRRLTLPGRYLVYAPLQDRVMISRQIEDEPERDRLTALMAEIAEPEEGFILRTASVGATADELARDAAFLRDLWWRIDDAAETAKVPSRLHAEIDPIPRILRDNALDDIDEIHIDDAAGHDSARRFCETFMPAVAGRLRLHKGPQPLFDAHGIEDEIERACQRRIDIPSGGGIVVEPGETLTAIDVNSGSFAGAADLEQTAFRINREAALEAARQIRLRNIGGLIVIDFIHMEDDAHWDAVLDILEEEFSYDRNPTRVLGVTEAGLVEITRRRRRESLLHTMTRVCDACGGIGRVRSVDTVALEVLRALRRDARSTPPGTLVLHVAGDIAAALGDGFAPSVEAIAGETGRRVEIRGIDGYARESFDIVVE